MAECDECYDSGTIKVEDPWGGKAWADCPYCNVAEERERKANREHSALIDERNGYRQILETIAGMPAESEEAFDLGMVELLEHYQEARRLAREALAKNQGEATG